MAERINVHEVLSLHPNIEDMADGEQVHYNHPNCPAGSDTKRRLFIKRDSNVWLFFCHHCGGKGYRRHGKVNHLKQRHKLTTHDELHLPEDFVIEQADCHVLANAWLNKYGITMAERRHYRIGWSEREGRVILPVWMDGELVAFQRRRVLPYDEGPKYTTARKAGVDQPVFSGGFGKGMTSDIMVLTEDILSSIVVGRQVTTTALLGVFLPESQVPRVLRFNPEEVIIALDDDNPAVRKAQRVMVRRLTPYTDVRKLTGHDTDPKEMTDEAIKLWLRWSHSSPPG